MLQGETWATHFAGKREGGVEWDGKTFMCPRWFITGQCFKNCLHLATHVKKEDVPEAKLTAFADYMKSLPWKMTHLAGI